MSIFQDRFDNKLRKIEHFHRYPEMLPAIGCDYGKYCKPILLIGESHYFPPGRAVPDAGPWYSGTSQSLEPTEKNWINTRGLLEKEKKNGKWSSRTLWCMYGNIEKVLSAKLPKCDSMFRYIAYMNCFQRPAANKDSFANIVTVEDVRTSIETINAVIDVIRPDSICIVSAFVWKTVGGGITIKPEHTSHPCSQRHWHGPWGKKRLSEFFNKNLL
jgi:hypothetical protein